MPRRCHFQRRSPVVSNVTLLCKWQEKKNPTQIELGGRREISSKLESQPPLSLVLARGLRLRPATIWMSFGSHEDCFPRGCRCCVDFGSLDGNKGCHSSHSGNNNLPSLESSGSGREQLRSQLRLAQNYATWSAGVGGKALSHTHTQKEQEPIGSPCKVKGVSLPTSPQN